jgi:hypothetical protein
MCGVLSAVLGACAIQSLPYGGSSRDPLAIVVAIAILLAAAGGAVFLPAIALTTKIFLIVSCLILGVKVDAISAPSPFR